MALAAITDWKAGAEAGKIPLLTWGLLRQVFTVETLMTPRRVLFTGEQGADLARVRSEAGRRRFDLVPMTHGGRIVSVLPVEAREPEPLIDRRLVCRDTAISDLLGLFVESGRPGFLVFWRPDVVGLVTPADLNKLPAQIYLHHLIGEVELALARRIQGYFSDDPSQLLHMLSAKRRKELEDYLAMLAEGNVDVDPMQLLRLSDVINIAAKHEDLRAELGFSSRRATEKALGGLNDLRNRTMHPVRPLLERIPEDLERLQRYGQQAGEVLRRLEVV
ncbi:MAG: hypothetical protein P8189_12775 [Anaerolineae bacterium]